MYEFGERIYNLRKKSGLSQEEFADKLGVSRQAVSKWETGQSVPDSEKAAAIGAFFGVSLDWLINGVENASSIQQQPLAEAQEQPAVLAKKKTLVGRAFLYAAVITFALIGLSAVCAFTFMMIGLKVTNNVDSDTFFMLFIAVPGWLVLYLVSFTISFVVIKKKSKK